MVEMSSNESTLNPIISKFEIGLVLELWTQLMS